MKNLITLVVLFVAQSSFAAQLVINSAEFGVGKFHRYDNKQHAYGNGSAWAPYVLPEGARTDKPLITKNSDGSFTVFFSTLDDLIASVIKISNSEKMKVSVLNIHGHGLPGGMWFPKDAATLADFECSDWRDAANGDDEDNYSQYYSNVSPAEIEQIRSVSNNPNYHAGCTTGLKEWKQAVANTPAFKNVFAPDAQLHFLSCVVGLGRMGDQFTQGVAELLLPQGAGHVETSVNFGLGDWSMPDGMGFWDMQTASQVNRDMSGYVVNHRDSDIAQKGTIRLASFSSSRWSTSLLANRDFMSLAFESRIAPSLAVSGLKTEAAELSEIYSGLNSSSMPAQVRIPGTTARVAVTY